MTRAIPASADVFLLDRSHVLSGGHVMILTVLTTLLITISTESELAATTITLEDEPSEI